MSTLTANRNELMTSPSESILLRYYEQIRESYNNLKTDVSEHGFEPTRRLPPLDSSIERFLQPSAASYSLAGSYKGLPLHILDLRKNPGTHTTKTLASALIVLRAINHIREEGERIILFSPSSGNKATALRDAVERALTLNLVGEGQLRIATLTPEETLFKMRASQLTSSKHQSRLHPMFILKGGPSERVKKVGLEVTKRYQNSGNTRLWNSLRIENYRVADQARAFFDYEFGQMKHPGLRFVHAHAVSSAYGLLGYQSGIDTLRDRGLDARQPGYLLVQHLSTCDMVLHAAHGTFDRSNIPSYSQAGDGLWRQNSHSDFPSTTFCPNEILERTFYTQKPATSNEMSSLIHQHGGGGIVVSLHECLSRYAEIRHILSRARIYLPSDPRNLCEWSIVMAMTGVLNAVDRGLLEPFDAITLHASGAYSSDDYIPVPRDAVNFVRTADDVLSLI